MRAYETYMARQEVSPDLHARLLALEAPQKKKKGGSYMKFSALAACAALIFGLGSSWLTPKAPEPTTPVAVETAAHPEASMAPDEAIGDYHGFVAQGPGEEADKLMFPAVWGVDYTDVTHSPELAASLAFPQGSYWVELSKEDIQKIFWGAQGKPAVENPKTDTGDFPLFLMNWQGYAIAGTACYDGEGALYRLTITGEKGEDSFTLTLCPGHIPPECCVDPDLKTTTVVDTAVTGWYKVYDCDGDGREECIVTASFMAGDYGVTFKNIGSGGSRASETEGGDATELGGARLFNAMLVNHFCRRDSEPYLDHLLRNGDIPAWREEKLETIDAALAETDFAPYLPQSGPKGYNEFNGHLSYQEGCRNYLFVRWSKYLGYDDVEVAVYLPEDPEGYPQSQEPVDVTVPESYDWRLYDIPICDNVPKEYQLNFYKPTFRAEDMSLEVVKARMNAHDTGGEICHFYVRHENGVVVSYDCAGVSAEYVWSLVEATL